MAEKDKAEKVWTRFEKVILVLGFLGVGSFSGLIWGAASYARDIEDAKEGVKTNAQAVSQLESVVQEQHTLQEKTQTNIDLLTSIVLQSRQPVGGSDQLQVLAQRLNELITQNQTLLIEMTKMRKENEDLRKLLTTSGVSIPTPVSTP